MSSSAVLPVKVPPIGSLLSTTIDMLIGFWVLQGPGAAACMTMGQVIVNDVYQGTEAA